MGKEVIEKCIFMPDKHVGIFLGEMQKLGFENPTGIISQEHGFSGPYYTYSLANQDGANIYIRYGGRMPFAVLVEEDNFPLVVDILKSLNFSLSPRDLELYIATYNK